MLSDFFNIKKLDFVNAQNDEKSKKPKKILYYSFPSYPHKKSEKRWKNRRFLIVFQVIHTKTYVFSG